MRFAQPTCPECGMLADRITECVLLDQLLVQEDDGSFDYDSDEGGDICWDSQEAHEIDTPEGTGIELGCGHHRWYTRFVPDPDNEPAVAQDRREE
jgi:hypothetical protein